MQGPHNAKKFVTDYLSGNMRARLDDYRYARREEGEWYLDDSTLPEPVKYLSYEPLALDDLPAVITVVISTQRFTIDDYTAVMDPIYRVVYNMRTYIWCKADSNEAATIMRDRLTTVVRSALLDYPCLRTYSEQYYLQVMMNETTMQEQFSDITLLKGDRALAGSYLSYDLEVTERITRMPLGEVDTFDIELEGAGMNQPLPD